MTRRPITRALIPLVLALSPCWLFPAWLASPLSPPPAAAQTSPTESTERAEPRVFGQTLRPHWLEGGSSFWYQRTTDNAFVFVDARSRTKSPLFDHDRVADSLAARTGTNVAATDLPIYSLDVEDNSLVLHGKRQTWRLDRATYELTPAEEGSIDLGLPFDLVPRPSLQSGADTEITFLNRLDETVRVFWSDGSSGRHLYATLNPGGRHVQHTFAGHVWVIVNESDDVVAVFEGASRPNRAIIDGRNPSEDSKAVTERAAEETTEDDRATEGKETTGTETEGESDTKENQQADDPHKGVRIVSPDGKLSAYARDNNLWIRDETIETDKPFDVRGEPSRAEAQLTFDGTSADGYQENAQRERLVELNYSAEDPPMGVADILWSPDSRHFVALRSAIVSEHFVHMIEAAPSDRLQPRLHRYPYLKPGDELPVRIPHVFDAINKREIALDTSLFENPWNLYGYHWTPNGQRCFFVFNERGHGLLRVLEVNVRTGETTVVVEETSDTFIDYSSKFYLEHLDATDELIWMSERDGWNHLYLYDRRTRSLKNQITRGEWVVRQVDRVDAATRRIWFQAGGILPEADPYHLHHCRIDFDGENLDVLTSGAGDLMMFEGRDGATLDGSDPESQAKSPFGLDGAAEFEAALGLEGAAEFEGVRGLDVSLKLDAALGHHTLEWSPDSTVFVDTWSRVDQPPVHVLRDGETGEKLLDLEASDASEFVGSGRSFPEPFVAKGRDGRTDIYGIIHRPRDFDPNRTYPVIEQIYAGPHGQHVPKKFRTLYGNRSLADCGFIVVQIDGMGTNWRSKSFHDVAWKNLVDAGFPDRIAWIRAAAEKYPQMDFSKVGIYGGSAGGQNALSALLTHPGFYKVAVADCGCHDNRMDKVWWNEQWMGYPVGPHYEEQSNVTLAPNLEGELLLIVGELDRNVDPASTMQVVHALVEADKDFEMLVLPGIGHGAAGTTYGRRRLEEFFVRHLLSD